MSTTAVNGSDPTSAAPARYTAEKIRTMQRAHGFENRAGHSVYEIACPNSGAAFDKILFPTRTPPRQASLEALLRLLGRWIRTYLTRSLEIRRTIARTIIAATATDPSPRIGILNAFFQAHAHVLSIDRYHFARHHTPDIAPDFALNFGAELLVCGAAIPLIQTWLHVTQVTAKNPFTMATAYELEGDALVSSTTSSDHMQALACYARATAAYAEVGRMPDQQQRARAKLERMVSMEISQVLTTPSSDSSSPHPILGAMHAVVLAATQRREPLSIHIFPTPCTTRLQPAAPIAVDDPSTTFGDITLHLRPDGIVALSISARSPAVPDAPALTQGIGLWDPTDSIRPALLAEFDHWLEPDAARKGPWLAPDKVRYLKHYIPDARRYYERCDARGVSHRLWLERNGSVVYQVPHTAQHLRIAARLPPDQLPPRDLADDLHDAFHGRRG